MKVCECCSEPNIAPGSSQANILVCSQGWTEIILLSRTVLVLHLYSALGSSAYLNIFFPVVQWKESDQVVDILNYTGDYPLTEDAHQVGSWYLWSSHLSTELMI